MNQQTDMPHEGQAKIDERNTPLYTSLDHDTLALIRLIKVKPHQPDDANDSTIECTMTIVPVHDMEDEYFALSYVWGDPSDRKPIIINGHRYMVTVNLEAFLQQLRDNMSKEHFATSLDIPFWIDAISINQEDRLELSRQVSLMGLIYKSARATVSWLGHGSKSCESGLASIRSLGSHVQRFLEDGDRTNYLRRETWPDAGGLYDMNTTNYYQNTEWNNIAEIIKLEYWNRAWIQQEIVLAKVVYLWYDDAFADFNQLRLMQDWLDRIKDQPCPEFFHKAVWRFVSQYPFRAYLGIRFLLRRLELFTFEGHSPSLNEGDPSRAFISLYLLVKSVKATKPVDLLYALLGVWDLGIQPDYTQTVDQVYHNFAADWITRKHGLVFLLAAGGTAPPLESEVDPRSRSLPSWVPRWNSLVEGLGNTGIAFDKAESTTDSIFCAVEITGSILHVCGFIVSVVAWDQSINADNLEGFLNSYLGDGTNGRSIDRKYRIRKFLQFICGKMHPISRRPFDFATGPWDESLSDFLRLIELETAQDVADKLLQKSIPSAVSPVSPAVHADTNNTDWQPLAAQLAGNLAANTMFTTVQSHIGWSSWKLKKDDVVCVLFGLKAQVILRKLDKDSFMFISACHIPGLRESELLAPELDYSRIQTFNIR